MKLIEIPAGIAFPHAALAIQITRTRRPFARKRVSRETVYAVTDLTNDDTTAAELADAIRTEARMTAVLDELHLMTELATSITGLSALGAAAILCETGDVKRFATGRALVKHAGLAPREWSSGNFTGRAKLTGQGRPGFVLRRDGRCGSPTHQPGL